ncbi:MAG: hypothetical protein K6E38_05970 [Fretibacterium sp.]|nr:hypothetical protein [Fretibacterium sp.]
MSKSSLKFSFLLLALSIFLGAGLALQDGTPAWAAQTINGKALNSVDDVVKEVSKGDISLPKKGLITLRGGDFNGNSYVDVFAEIFDKDASASNRKISTTYPTSDPAIGKYEEKPKWRYALNNSPFWNPQDKDATVRVPLYAGEGKFFRPAVSRSIYNGKRALMFHNLAPNGSLKYYFKALSNNRTESANATTTAALVNSVQISDIGTYTSPNLSGAENSVAEVYGTGVMSVKGYERDIFVAASGATKVSVQEGYDSSYIPGWRRFYKYVSPEGQNDVRLEFFGVGPNDKGNLTQEPLTALTQTTSYNGYPKIVSLAVGDFDGDKYNNEVALMINTNNNIWLFVYRLTLSDGKLVLRALGDASGLLVHSTDQWGSYIENQPATDMVAGDFDGDGKSEIAVLFKFTGRITDPADIKDARGWPDGPMGGDVYCRIYRWNAEKRAVEFCGQGIKSYTQKDVNNGTWDEFPQATVSGILGLRAAAADLDGDGKDEIVTLLLGYYHRKAWDSKIKVYKLRRDDFYAYPHLAVWTFNRGSTTPVHDSHVKGGGQGGEYRYNWGILYDMSDNKGKGLLMNDPHLEYRYIWYDSVHTGDNRNEGRNPDYITNMYALHEFSIAAGPFAGTLGQVKTVEDIAVAWKDKNGADCVTVFKTKLNGSKQFDGFEDGKLVMWDKAASANNGEATFRGLVAVDLAGEGVELGTPVHLRKKSNRSYIAALNAVPYHVDTVKEDGTALTGGQPVNFTYSDVSNGGNMTVSYGKTTTDSKSDTVKQDLSQSVETMLAADPEMKGAETFGKVKGLIGFASAIGDIAHGIKIGNMTTEQKRDAVWKPDSPTEGLTEMLDFFTDKVDKVDERSKSETSTTTIEKTITATTHDAILYTDTARHIWRYPVMTRPLPMWLAYGPRIDSTQVGDPTETLKKGEKELFLTFTMSENSPLHTSSSITDALYQPLHEEGNFFSYPANIADVEGYNEDGLLADENTWEFSNNSDNTGMSFTKATSDMQHTETKVTPSGFTATSTFFDRLIKGDKSTGGIKMPDSDNPKTFSKEYSKSERISFSLQGSSSLTSKQAADHTIKMQPFVAKEGAMTLGTAVTLSTVNSALLWDSGSIYQQKADPALLLPQKFLKDATGFIANTHDKSAMKIRGVKFYMPDFAFLTDNRLAKGQNYEIRVPLYNASFKPTGNFDVRLSWTTDNSPTAPKTQIATKSISLDGWNNDHGGWYDDKKSNKGWAVFEWTPNLATNKQYYLCVEIDPEHKLEEVHEERYGKDNKISDFGGNNTGFYPFYVYNQGDVKLSGSGVVVANSAENIRVAGDGVQLMPLSFEDGDGKSIPDVVAYIKDNREKSFVTITTKFTYSGPELPYAFLTGCTLTQSGRKKVPNAGINTVVDLNALSVDDIDDVFMLEDIALFKGVNSITSTISPSEVTDEALALAASATFGIISLNEEDIKSAEEYFEGVDPSFTPEEIPANIVSNATAKTYTLTADEDVFWKISSVKISRAKDSGAVSTSAEGDDDSKYLDIALESVNEDSDAPSNYGKTVFVTVSSIAGYTPKGEYEITAQKSTDGCEDWTDAGVLKFTAADSRNNSGGASSSSSSGCNAGLGLASVALVAFIRKMKF